MGRHNGGPELEPDTPDEMTPAADAESAAGGPSTPLVERRRSAAASSAWITYGILAVVLVAWELAVAGGLVDGRFLSSPTRIVSGLASLAREADVRTALTQTVYALTASFVIGAALGLVVGLLLGMNRLLRDAFLPVVIGFLGIPKSVFLPLFILLFGLGQGPGIAFGIVLSSIQVVINVVGGVDSIDKVHYQVARAYGAPAFQVFKNIILPGAAPGIFAGMWHGIRNAFIGVVVAQLFVSNIGVGYLVRRYTSQFRIDEALALVFFVAVGVILVGNAWGVLERRLSSWKAAVR